MVWLSMFFGEVSVPTAFTQLAGTLIIREGFSVGTARVGGVDCEHWAFRQEDADWEI